MELMPIDRLAAETHLANARENLRALGALLQPQAPGGASGAVRTAIATAVGALDGAARALDPNAAEEQVACPFCRERVMRSATLCRSCWRKLGPARD